MALFALAMIVYGITWAVVNKKKDQEQEKELIVAVKKFADYLFIAIVVLFIGFGFYYS